MASRIMVKLSLDLVFFLARGTMARRARLIQCGMIHGA
jgi:hypothetical protein